MNEESPTVTIPAATFDLMLEALEVVNVAPEVRGVAILDEQDIQCVRWVVMKGQEVRAELEKTA